MQFYMPLKLLLIIFIALYPDVIHGYNTSVSEGKNSSKSSISAVYRRDASEIATNCIIKPKVNGHLFFKYGFVIFAYFIDDEQALLVQSPNRIRSIRFNGFDLVFDENVKLPDRINWPSIVIYTCEGNDPLFIRMFGSYGFYLYSSDLETGRWNNYIPPRLGLYEMLDANGVLCYNLKSQNELDKFFDELYRQWSGQCNEIWKDTKLNHNLREEPVLEITIENYGMDILPIADHSGAEFTEMNHEGLAR